MSRDSKADPQDEGEDEVPIENIVEKMDRVLRAGAENLTRSEARFLVDAYYRMQEQRIRFAHQIRTMKSTGENHKILDWFMAQSTAIENQIKGALDVHSRSDRVGKWMRSIIGVGPVIASGFLSHLDIRPWRCKAVAKKGSINMPCRADDPCTEECGHDTIQYVGQWWSFAGLNPSVKWKSGEKRPWNTPLKTLCYKLGESFVKVQNNPKDFYGKLFVERKSKEWDKNLSGGNAKAAEKNLESKNIGKKTAAYAWYSGMVDPAWARKRLKSGKAFPQTVAGFPNTKKGVPMLPPAQIHARARRWTVKLFLSHLHEVSYFVEMGELPPQPFVLTMDDHNRKIEVPYRQEFEL